MIRTVQYPSLWKVDFLTYPTGGGRTFWSSCVIRAESQEDACRIFNESQKVFSTSVTTEDFKPLEVIEDV